MPKTIAPVEAGTTREAEWVDFPGLEKIFSLRRGHAYTLISSGEIRSVVLRQRGKIRGKRLVEVASGKSMVFFTP